MRIIDDALLAALRRQETCEWCNAKSRTGRDPHHYWYTRGHCRLDVPENLVALCRSCHQAAGTGAISRRALLTVVAIRMNLDEDVILTRLYDLRRRPKESHES